jgi:hypothetical protein
MELRSLLLGWIQNGVFRHVNLKIVFRLTAHEKRAQGEDLARSKHQ